MPSPAEIKQARAKAGLTQTEAAELLGVTRMAWTRYEAGNRHLTPAQWEYWLHVAGIKRIPFRTRKNPG